MLCISLFVRLLCTDVPNAPQLLDITCNKRDASIQWQPMGDNRAPILRYTIQYNTSFTPDSWEVAFDSVPATDKTYTVSIQIISTSLSKVLSVLIRILFFRFL